MWKQTAFHQKAATATTTKDEENIENDDDDFDGDNRNGNDEKEARIYWPNIVLARSMWLKLYSVHPSLILSISRTFVSRSECSLYQSQC